MRFDVQVETSPRAGIADPEGATIERSLPALGFEGFTGVRVGKSIRFEVEAAGEDEARSRVERGVRHVPHQPRHRGLRRDRHRERRGRRREPPDRRRAVPRLQLRAGRHRGRARPGRRGRTAVARRRRRWARSTRSSSPAGSPTATTSVRAPSPASRPSWTRCATSPTRAARSSASATVSRSSPRPECCPVRCRRTPD